MGKPIAGRNKSPFGADGITVDTAVLKDGTELSNIKISKQRSDVMFDLLDGSTVHTFLELTGKDADGQVLKADSEGFSVKPGQFVIAIRDDAGAVQGYATKLLLNKAVLADGSVVYLRDYTAQEIIPAEDIEVSESDFDVSFSGVNGSGVATVDADIENVAVSFAPENGLSNGDTVTVTAKADSGYTVNGKAQDTFDFEVSGLTVLVESFTIDPNAVTVAADETATANITFIRPTNADDKTFKVEVADEDIATATISGTTVTITGVTDGETTFTVTSNDGNVSHEGSITVSTEVEEVSVDPK